VHANYVKLRKIKYRLFNNIIWRNIVYIFYLITVNLKQPTVSQNRWGKNVCHYIQVVCNDNESKIEIIIKTNYQLNMKITTNLNSISPLTVAYTHDTCIQ